MRPGGGKRWWSDGLLTKTMRDYGAGGTTRVSVLELLDPLILQWHIPARSWASHGSGEPRADLVHAKYCHAFGQDISSLTPSSRIIQLR